MSRRTPRASRPRDLPPGGADRITVLETLSLAQREGRLLVARTEAGRSSPASSCSRTTVTKPTSKRSTSSLNAAGWASVALSSRPPVPKLARRASSRSLSTFRDVAWNGPFYTRAGFEEIAPGDWTEALREAAAEEAAAGLDPERRVMMRRRLYGTSEA